MLYWRKQIIIFATRDKVNVYTSEHLIRFDDYISISSSPPLKRMTSHKPENSNVLRKLTIRDDNNRVIDEYCWWIWQKAQYTRDNEGV